MDVYDITGPWPRPMSKPFSFNDHREREKNDFPPVPDKTHAVQQLLALLPTRPDVAFLRTDPPFLLRFLRAKKFRVGDAFLLLCRYFEYRQQHRELFRGLNTGSRTEDGGESAIQMALMDGLPGVLSERDPCGRPVIVLLASNWDHSRYDVRIVYQAVLLTLECLVEDEAVQAAGVIVILDWSNFPARLTTSLSPKLLRLMLDGLQDAFPLRLGSLHLVNQPWYVEAAFGLARPFMKEKLRSRIHMHGNNLATLHAQVPPRLLPAELGGEGGEYHAHLWATTMLNYVPNKPQPNANTPTTDSTKHTQQDVPSSALQSPTSPSVSANTSTLNNINASATSSSGIQSASSPLNLVDASPKSQSWTSNTTTSSVSQNTPLVNKTGSEERTLQNTFTSMLFGRKDSNKTANGTTITEGEELALKAH